MIKVDEAAAAAILKQTNFTIFITHWRKYDIDPDFSVENLSPLTLKTKELQVEVDPLV